MTTNLSAADISFLSSDVEDHTHFFRLWPNYYRQLMLSSHLKFVGRFQLTLFLLGNRLNPEVIVKWYIRRGMLHDHAARVHVARIITDHRDGKLANKTTYVMKATTSNGDAPSNYQFNNGHTIEQGEIQNVVTPSFARCHYDNVWTNAVKMLHLGTSREVHRYCGSSGFAKCANE